MVSGPAVEPVSVAEVKANSRIDDDGDDNLIEGLIKSARQHMDGHAGTLGRALMHQTYDLVLDGFPGLIRLPLPPLVEVVSVKYLDESGAEQTLAADQYRVLNNGDRMSKIEPAFDTFWPATQQVRNAVTVRFTCGYADSSESPIPFEDVPQPIRQAIMLMAGHWYEQREAVAAGVTFQEVPMTAEALMAPYRVHAF